MAAAHKKAPAKKAAPAAKAAAPKSEAKEVAVSGDASAAALQALADADAKKGYFGITNDPHPNEAYSLATGPDSPSAADKTGPKAKKET